MRVRPLNSREKKMNAKEIVTMSGKQTQLQNPEMEADKKKFTFDFSYDSSCDPSDRRYTTQTQVYQDLGTDVVNACFDGFNGCVFAYGQTGSGKSYSMMGYGEKGLIPRICEGIFTRSKKLKDKDDTMNFACDVEYLEIYNEKVRDLLSNAPKGKVNHALRVREDPKRGPFVDGLTARTVTSFEEIDTLMEQGNSNRTTAATNMNDTSSRSHAVFTLKFTQASIIEGVPCEKTSKINLVDLAGSERTSSTGATGLRLKEGGNINKSLTTLGLVISALAERSKSDGTKKSGDKKSKKFFVPYRDSVLTWLLKESLGGNSKTIMLAAISPADVNYGETLSTLHYANRAKNIVNKAIVNEDENVRVIKELREEILRLKDLLGGDKKIAELEAARDAARKRLEEATTDEERALIESELADAENALTEQQEKGVADSAALANLQNAEKMMSSLTDAWKDKWQDQTRIMEDRALGVSESGKSALTINSEVPHLVSLNLDDPLATGVTLFYLQEGITLIGKVGTVNEMGSAPDIELNGDDAMAGHAEIENSDDSVVLIPGEEGMCMVNGESVVEPTEIFQGNTIVLGRQNIFRFNHPKQAANLRATRANGGTSADASESVSPNGGSAVWSPGQLFNTQSEADRLKEREQFDEIQRKMQELEEAQREREVENAAAMAEKERLEDEREKMMKDAAALSAKLQQMSDMVSAKDASLKKLESTSVEEKARLEELQAIAQAKEKLEAEQARAKEELEMMRMQNEKLQREQEERIRREAEQAAKIEISLQEKDELAKQRAEEAEAARLKMEEETAALQAEHLRKEEEMRAKMIEAEERIKKKEEEAQARIEAQLAEAKKQAEETARLEAEREAERKAALKREEEAKEAKRLAEAKEAEVLEAKRAAEEAVKAAKQTEEQLKALQSNNEAKELERRAEAEKRMEEEAQRRKQVAMLEHKLKRAETLTVRHRDEAQSFDEVWVIKVPRFHHRDSTGSGKAFTVFEVKIWLRGDEWKVFRRFSEFEQLHKSMKKKFSQLKFILNSLSFPSKEVFKSLRSKTDPEFLKQRRMDLERYIQELVRATYMTPGTPFYRTNKKKLQRDLSFFNNAAALDLG